MTDNDQTRCAWCGYLLSAHPVGGLGVVCPGEPQPAPPSGLTAEQRATLEVFAHLQSSLGEAVRAALAEIDRLAKLVNDQNGTLAAFADRAVEAEAERDALKQQAEIDRETMKHMVQSHDERVAERDALRAEVRRLTSEAAIALDESSRLRALVAEMRGALEFYADPETYFAITFLDDPPSGDFMDDFSDDHGGEFDRPMPGKRARAALAKGDG